MAEAEASEAGQLLREWRSQLTEDAGGEASLSAARRMLVDMACVSRLTLAALDSYLLSRRGGIVDRRTGEVARAVRDREAVAAGLLRQLQALGLDRVARPTRSLAEIMRADALAAQQEAAQRDARAVVEVEAVRVEANAPAVAE